MYDFVSFLFMVEVFVLRFGLFFVVNFELDKF